MSKKVNPDTLVLTLQGCPPPLNSSERGHIIVLPDINQEMLDALIATNQYFIDLQNKCALTSSDERAWKLVSKAIYNTQNEK